MRFIPDSKSIAWAVFTFAVTAKEAIVPFALPCKSFIWLLSPELIVRVVFRPLIPMSSLAADAPPMLPDRAESII